MGLGKKIKMAKEKSLFWGKETGKEVVKASWEGAKMVGLVVVAGAALGLGLGAMDSVSS